MMKMKNTMEKRVRKRKKIRRSQVRRVGNKGTYD
jgi:hypothetical protein